MSSPYFKTIMIVLGLQTLFLVPAHAESSDLSSFRVKLQTKIPASVGISGVHFNPETRRLGLVDNNMVNMKEVSLEDPSVVYRTVTLAGFKDPEATAFVRYDKESNKSLIAIFEENHNRVSKCWVDESVQDQTLRRLNPSDCPESVVLTREDGSPVWKMDPRHGLEAAAYDPTQDVFYILKQFNKLQFLRCHATGAPGCVEPFNAQAKWGKSVVDINDMSLDPDTGNLALISNTSNVILVVDPKTGEILETVDFTVWKMGFLCEEGFCYLPGGQAALSSEPGDLAILERPVVTQN